MFIKGQGKFQSGNSKKEKNLLPHLSTDKVRDSYRIKQMVVKVNIYNMIPYKSNQYSVPSKYQVKKSGLQVYDDQYGFII